VTVVADEGLVARARAALQPFPGRWKETLVVAGASTMALAVAVTLQVPSFAAPNVTYVALQHTTVCTWRNMITRLLLLLVVGVVVVPVGGVLVQTPWLLVPAFFVIVVALTYGVPSARHPVESLLIAFPLIGACFTGTYDPSSIAVDTRNLVAACAIGVVTATIFARLAARPSARLRLAESLAASLARSEQVFRESMARFDATPPPAGWPEAPVYSDLGGHVALLDLARQEGIGTVADRTLVTLCAAAERIGIFAGTIDTLSRLDVGRTYREAMHGEVDATAQDVVVAMRAFAGAARALATRETIDELRDGAPWPDFAGRTARLHARQLELRGSAEFAQVGVAESVNLNALVQALASLGDVLHTAPWDLRDLAADEQLGTPPVWPFNVFPVDRFALRFALQVGLGATIALVGGIAAHEPELSTLLWNPILVAQMSYGATIRKAGLRLAGVVLGGLLALLTMIVVFANTGDLSALLLMVFALAAGCQYCLLGMPIAWYGPFQVAVTYFVVVVAPQPTTNVGTALWRAFGTFVGTAVLFAVFRLVAPDYAGRQLVARFADLLRMALRYLPRGGVLPPDAELVAMRVASARASADILRLTDESRLEGASSGVDPDAAVEAAGVSLRISLRSGLIARGRVTITWHAIPAEVAAALEAMHAALREHLGLDLAMVEARHTMATPGTRAHVDACRAARAHGTRPRPDLAGPLASLLDAVAAARRRELMTWTTEQSGALLAEVEHLRRLAQLVPRLDAALERMLLPDPTLALAHAPAPATPAIVAGAAVNRP
jgi:hypothetical protein